MTFPITMTGYQNYNLQVWAGSVDCSGTTLRVPGAGSTCWQVFGNIYLKEEQPGGNFVIPIYSRNIVAQNRPTLGTNSTGISEADISVCNVTGGNQQAIALYFMLVDVTGTIVNNAVATWTNTAFDISPPSPPTGIVLGGGEGHINVSWTASSDSDIIGYNFYCDPPPGPLATGDASILDLGPSLRLLALDGSLGAAGNGGSAAVDAAVGRGGTGGAGGVGPSTDGGTVTDGGVIVPQNCAPTALIAGTDPDPKYFCGSAPGNQGATGNGKAEHLVNNTLYVVSVGAVDVVGNVGKLSENQCATPIAITDFFELYRDLGGQGGCSLSGRPGRWPAAALGAVVSAMLLRRRRRRS